MTITTSRLAARALFGTLAAFAALQGTPAAAQSAPGPWQFRASIYGYLPSVSGMSRFPADSGGSTIDVASDKVVSGIKGFFMGALEANNGRWGVFTDYMYLHLSGSKQNSRDFSISGTPIDIGTSANLDWSLKGSIWTLAGEYRLPTDPSLTLDLLAGARMLRLQPSLRWDISGNLGSLASGSRSGSFEQTDTRWDAIVGVKGRYGFGASRRWQLPFYLDVGTGENKLTWQAAGGIGYAFSWGEITAMWRYLAYDMKSDKPVNDVKLSGPMLGATFTF